MSLHFLRTLGFFLLIPGVLSALDPAIPPNRYVIQSWNMADGLPQNTVSHILQTPDGYLWLGTGNGLVRFDGVQFEVFNSDNVPQIRGHDVLGLYLAPDDALWILYVNSLVQYRDGEFSYVETGTRMYPVTDAESGEIRILAREGIMAFRDGRFALIRRIPDLDRFKYRLLDEQGRVWILREKRLAYYHQGNWIPFPADSPVRVSRISVSVKNHWIMNTDQGRFCLDPRGWHHLPDGGNLPPFIRGAYRTGDGAWWIMTDRGLIRYLDGESETINTDYGLNDNDIMALLEDRQGILWVGTRTGLSQIRDPRIGSFSREEGLAGRFPRNLLEDRHGRIWISCNQGGVYRLENYRITRVVEKNGSGPLYEDEEGGIWHGLRLSVWHPSGVRLVLDSSGRNVTKPRVMIKDSSGAHWFGCSQGLIRLVGVERREWREGDGLWDSRIYAIREMCNGDLWIGTGRGLNVIREGKVLPPPGGEKAPQGFEIMSIHEDALGTAWLGTYMGLYRYRDGTWSRYSGRDGLPGSAILAVVEDRFQRLWCSSINGIFGVAKEDIDRYDRDGSRE